MSRRLLLIVANELQISQGQTAPVSQDILGLKRRLSDRYQEGAPSPDAGRTPGHLSPPAHDGCPLWQPPWRGTMLVPGGNGHLARDPRSEGRMERNKRVTYLRFRVIQVDSSGLRHLGA